MNHNAAAKGIPTESVRVETALTERWKIAMMAIHLRHQAHVGTTYKRALP